MWEYKRRVKSADIATIAQRQLDAYNLRDIDALMGVYHPEAKQFEFPTTLLASGAEGIRKRFLIRFAEPNLHARLRQRIVRGNFVVDHETVTRTFPEGPGEVELTAIYEVRDGCIYNAWFIPGEKTVMG
jgi:hypothetical protein